MVKVGVASGGCRSLFYTSGGGDDAVPYSIADCFLLFCVSKCALLLLVVVVVGVFTYFPSLLYSLLLLYRRCFASPFARLICLVVSIALCCAFFPLRFWRFERRRVAPHCIVSSCFL